MEPNAAGATHPAERSGLPLAARPVAWIIDRITAALSRLTLLAVRRMSPNAHRLRVLYSGSDPVLEKLTAVARLIEQYDAAQIARIEDHLISIKVRRMYDGTIGLYKAPVRQILLDERHVLEEPTEAVAMLLVHEAEHARRIISGESLTADNLTVVERACIDAELAFARRLPNGARFVSRGARRRNTVQTDYTESALSVRERKRRRFRPPD